MGSSTENSALQVTRNPWDLSRVPGGSSGGSAVAVASGQAAFGLGSDTGGSVRQPASFCGVYGLKPTWGAVSRFGLVAYASSLEVIGVMAKTVDMTEKAFSLMRGQDARDHSSLAWQPRALKKGKLTIGVPRECAEVPLHADVKKTFDATRSRLKDLGHDVQEVSFPTLDHVVSSYYVIATAEASANLARFDGVRYGHRTARSDNPEAMTIASRTEGLGPEVKLRILLGTYVLRSGFQDEYYLRAQKIRTAIRNDFNKAFDGVDLVLMPVYPVPAFRAGKRRCGSLFPEACRHLHLRGQSGRASSHLVSRGPGRGAPHSACNSSRHHSPRICSSPSAASLKSCFPHPMCRVFPRGGGRACTRRFSVLRCIHSF